MQSAIACTIPSPGFGTILMLSDNAAPIPVKTSASANTNRRITNTAVALFHLWTHPGCIWKRDLEIL